MKKVRWGSSELQVPAVAVGCMCLDSVNAVQAAALIERAVNQEVNFFDHADIYGGGRCEEIFAEAFKMTDIRREDVFIQSKCGILSFA